MILGLSTPLFTQIHVAICLIAIISGLLVALLMIAGRNLSILTSLFLITTVLTSVTGFFFPFHGVTPGIVVGIISLIVLLFTLIAYYSKHLAGGWRRVYVITAIFALYLNCFVLVAQMFQKIPSLHALAPTGTEGPFKITQATVLVLFLVIGFLANRKFGRPSII